MKTNRDRNQKKPSTKLVLSSETVRVLRVRTEVRTGVSTGPCQSVRQPAICG